MAPTTRYTKDGLSKFKSKEDPNIYIKEFNNIYQANKEIADEEKLVFFSITFKKQAFK